jgi:hypothetical protein
MTCDKGRNGFLSRFIILCAATLTLASCGGGGGGSSDNTPAPPPPPPPPVAQTWFFSDGAALTTSQTSSFDAQGLYFNVHSAANPGGEIRGQIIPSAATITTDAGSPAVSLIFSTLMSGDQEVPVIGSAATGYGTIVLNPVAKTISGVLVTNGIVGTAAHIHDGQTGVSGPVIIPLTGGPTVWTVPAGTVVTDDQIAKLKAGTYYLNVHSTGAPGGEIRGQLTRQVRFAAMSGANEVPAVTTTASGTGVLALDPTTNQIRGFVKTTGITGTAAHIHEQAAGVAGPVIVPLTQTPAGSGLWVVPAGQLLTASQAASFNAGNLYFNVHSAANPGGEIRGQIVAATLKIGNAALDGAKEVPPVTTTASGTGIMVLNSITKLVYGNLLTTGITGTAAHVHEAPAGVAGPVIVPLTLTPPPSTLVPVISTASLANGVVGSAYSQSLAATGGTTPYTWGVASGTLPAGLSLSAAGVISGTPTAAGSSVFTVRVTDSGAPAATATQALSLTITAAPVALAVSTASLANGTVGSAYSQSLTATGGTTPYSWAVATGTLPAGLNLSAAGTITGIPTAVGTSNFTVRVTDSASPAATATQALALTIAAAPVAAISFSTQIQPIFTANCTPGCHSPGGISAFMNLTAGNAYASLVQSSPPRVIAGNSATSLLYLKITGAVQPQMPLGRAPLSAADQTLIKNWIDQGAANN